MLSRRRKLSRCDRQEIVHCSSLIVHLSLWNSASPAMTNEQSTMNNKSASKFPPNRLCHNGPNQRADVLQPISQAILSQPVNDFHRRRRVVKVRGTDLNCVRPGDDEFERVISRRDSADP